MELGLVEQQLKSVHQVLDGATVTDVAKRNGVTTRPSMGGCGGMPIMSVLFDQSSKPETPGLP